MWLLRCACRFRGQWRLQRAELPTTNWSLAQRSTTSIWSQLLAQTVGCFFSCPRARLRTQIYRCVASRHAPSSESRQWPPPSCTANWLARTGVHSVLLVRDRWSAGRQFFCRPARLSGPQGTVHLVSRPVAPPIAPGKVSLSEAACWLRTLLGSGVGSEQQRRRQVLALCDTPREEGDLTGPAAAVQSLFSECHPPLNRISSAQQSRRMPPP